jgi:glycosyltransferase involved in cell wall biosynthesis
MTKYKSQMSNATLPLITVITTCYNRERYIGACIESVLNCKYENIEHVIVDDVSSDSSWEIIQRYAKEDSRIRAYRNQENQGDYPNRNVALKLAKGEFVKFVDGDDLLYPYALHFFVHYMEKYPEAVFSLSVEQLSSSKALPRFFPAREAIHHHYVHQHILFEGPTSSFIRRDAFHEIGFFSGKRMLGDFEAWHNLNHLGGCLLLPKGSTTFWREHDDQEMSFHRENLFYTSNEHLFSKTWLANQSNHTPDYQEALIHATESFHRWAFFILRTRPRDYTTIRKMHNLPIRNLIRWALPYYIQRSIYGN